MPTSPSKPFRYCPKCASPLKTEQHGGGDMPTCTNPDCRFIFWQNAKPATTAVIANDVGEVLLTVREIDPFKGKLDWPGGFILEDELPEDGLVRELKEELGVDVEIGPFLGHAHDGYGDAEYLVLSIGYIVRITNGEATADDEIASIEWLKPEDVDRSRLAFQSTPVFLDAYVEYLKKNPNPFSTN